MTLQYRDDIDGLRAIAVLAVVFYHVFPEFVGGGFVGVDIFFVISGYLISSIILNGVMQEKFSFKTFYARRIKRIFPALIIVLTVCLLLGWFFLLPDEYAEVSKHVLGGSGFISNILLWTESGYFDKAAELKPLLHLWSLGIEEQFYIAWPLILYLGWKKRINLFFLTGIMALMSFFLNIYLVQNDQAAAFYSPLSRFWELLVGVMLALSSLIKNEKLQALNEVELFQNAKSLLGACFIGYAVACLDKNASFPGWWALLPTIGAFLLISSGPNALFNRILLSNRLVVFVGLISYPLYLWHWPLLSYARITSEFIPTTTARIQLVVLSFFLAHLTYKLVEKPIRFTFVFKKITPVLSAAMVLVAIAGLTCLAMDGISCRFSQLFQAYVTYQYDFRTDTRANLCWLDNKMSFDGYKDYCVDERDKKKPLLMVWGDSHAACLFPGFKAILGDNYRMAQFTRDGCPPVLGLGYENCINSNFQILEKIKTIQPDTVILFAVWNNYLDVNDSGPVLRKIEDTVKELKDAGVSRIILIGPAPQWLDALPRNLLRQAINNGFKSIPKRTYFKSIPLVKDVDSILAGELRSSKSVTYFSAYQAMCDTSGCLTTVNGGADGLTSWDYGHLTTPGATFLARKLADTVGWPPQP